MATRPVESAIPLPVDRFTPPRHFGALVVTTAKSGIVDYQQPWDQLTSWFEMRRRLKQYP